MRRTTGVSTLARSLLAVSLAIGLAAGAVPASAGTTAGYDQGSKPGLSRLLDVYATSAETRAIATFTAVPTASQVSALNALGLVVQPMKHVPLALVKGSVDAMVTAVSNGTAVDVYPDEKVELLDTASSDVAGAALPRAAGYTGKGVTVAVVDSGCDGTHPDLADHVKHNVKLLSAEYANIPPDASNTIVVPIDQGPYKNTDLGSGHGTHVSGIIAADGTTGPNHYGMAPDAELVCLSIGEVLFTTAVVTAYDYLLDQPEMWSVDVINNSWGNSFRMFDPRDPVHVVTKAVTDNGAVVVFAAGNSGHSNAEMGLNPFSSAPWVVSVASVALNRTRANSSSNGLRYDNSGGTAIGPAGHTVFGGNTLGQYHPDVAAPGNGISSTCTPTGTAILCPAVNGNATASGTSMASPHVAGALAVLRQVRPTLDGEHLVKALQSTATAVPGGTESAAWDFWQVGYGLIDLNAAVSLIRQTSPGSAVNSAQAAADQRFLAARPYTIPRSEFWTYDAPRVAVAGSDARTFTASVANTITHLKVTLSHPSGAVVGTNQMVYTVTVKDAAGKVLGTTTEATTGAGTANVLIDLAAVSGGVTYGTFSFAVSGQRAVSDPDTLDSESLLGRLVTLQVAQLVTK